MFAIIHLLATFIADLFKPPRRLEVENLFLRHQLNIALKRAPGRIRLRGSDRAFMAWMTWLWPCCSRKYDRAGSLEQLTPSEFVKDRMPIPTQIVSSDEYLPAPQNENQR